MVEKNNRKNSTREVDKEFEQRIIDLARVTRVKAGGKRMRFRACVVIGDHAGRLGYGLAKGADVTLAVNKAYLKAKRNLIQIAIDKETIPHAIKEKYKAARVLLKPAPQGSGIIAGGVIRSALEISGVSNIVAKIYGSRNKINNIKALFSAFKKIKV